MQKDILGKALLDFYNGNYTEDIITETNISDEDVLPLPYLFRSFSEMPLIEQKSLHLCKGKVLDVGCGAGSHALYLQEKGFDVTAIDISEGAIKVCKNRGIKKTQVKNILDIDEEFDTILLLMNGTGIFQNLALAPKYLNHLKSLLTENGQILIDSSDLIYMYEVEDDGGVWIPGSQRYYGELTFIMSYKGIKTNSFEWLYVHFELLKSLAESCGLQCELIKEGEHYDYLARLSL